MNVMKIKYSKNSLNIVMNDFKHLDIRRNQVFYN
jgi:hypothetical protein